MITLLPGVGLNSGLVPQSRLLSSLCLSSILRFCLFCLYFCVANSAAAAPNSLVETSASRSTLSSSTAASASLTFSGIEDLSSYLSHFIDDAVVVSASPADVRVSAPTQWTDNSDIHTDNELTINVASGATAPFSAVIASSASYVNASSVYYNFDFIGYNVNIPNPLPMLPVFTNEGLSIAFTRSTINPLCQYYLCIKPLVRAPPSLQSWSWACDSLLNISTIQSPQDFVVYPRPGPSHITVAVFTTDLTQSACNFEATLSGSQCVVSNELGGNCTAVAAMNTNTTFTLTPGSGSALGPPSATSSFSFEVNPTAPFANDISVSIGVSGNAPVFIYERSDDLPRLFLVGDLTPGDLAGVFDSQKNTSLATQSQTQTQIVKFDLALPALRVRTANSRYLFTAAVPNGYASAGPVNVQVNVTQTTCPVTFYGTTCKIASYPISSFGTFNLANTNFIPANTIYWLYAPIALTGAETGLQIGIAYQIGVDTTTYSLPDIYLRAGNLPDEQHFDALVNTSTNGVKFYDSGPLNFDGTAWFLGLRMVGPQATQTQSKTNEGIVTSAVHSDPSVEFAEENLDGAESKRKEMSQMTGGARSSPFSAFSASRNAATAQSSAASEDDSKIAGNDDNAESSSSVDSIPISENHFVTEAVNLFVLWTQSGCPSSCSGHGSCVNNVCQCDPNYTSLIDCSVYQVTISPRLSTAAKALLVTFAIIGSIVLGWLLCYYFRHFPVQSAMPGAGNVLGSGNAPGGGAAAPLSGSPGSSGAFAAARPASSSASANAPGQNSGGAAGAGPRGNIYGYNSLS